MSSIADKTLTHHRPYHVDIYKPPNVVSLHTLPQHRIGPHMGQHMSS